MRTDQYAYQQATRIAGLGLILQLAIGLVLFVVGSAVGSTAFVQGSTIAFVGVAVWAVLIVVFHQHRLAAIEAMEADELRAAGADSTVFASERAGDAMVAAKRLQRLNRILLPAVSLLAAGALALTGVNAARYISSLDFRPGADQPIVDVIPFSVGFATGWQLAICVSLALIAFIFSRFVAGMSKQPAWQNLRGGAGFMVGTALVLSAIAVGLVANSFGKPKWLEPIVLAIGIGQVIFAGEIILNFILALYRPRRIGDNPRAPFDSRILSLLAAPDSIVRSINEAVNYQFGFDITSSWGYQLMLRSTAWLLVLGATVLVALSCVVVVPPGQQAVRLRGGAIVGDVYEGTVMLKWPWPIETASVQDVARLRSLVLGARPIQVGRVNVWSEEENNDPDRYPYMVAAPLLSEQVQKDLSGRSETDAQPDASAAAVSQRFALVDADIVMSYRIAPKGLLDWLAFSSDTRVRRTASDMRERILRDIALREVTRYLSTQPMDAVLSPRGDSLVRSLRERIQASFDAAKTGVEVVAIQIPTLRPPAGQGAGMFEEISIDMQNARKLREEADRMSRASMAAIAGSPDRAEGIVAAIAVLEDAERQSGVDSAIAMGKRAIVERLLVESKGGAARIISQARAKRWAIVMGAAGDSAEVLGQAPSFHAAPELYKQFRTMQVLGRALAGVRVKYVLGESVAGRADIDVTMKQAESGLNLADYLEKKEKPPVAGEGN
jgi:regulator of protease activity HflC (stomatin/prohibitin superfamily)